jgi:GNAT superfamily N-acetyltransferase
MMLRIEKLRRDHRVEGFDCGKEPLNRFLIRFALQSQLSNSSQVYLAISEDEVVGFYTLAFGDVNYEDAPERLRKGVARHPIPLMILARLAVASAWAGKRIGSGLLKDALARTLAAAEIAGLRAFAVHAKDDEARAFYERFDFIASPSDPMHLFVLLKDVRALIGPDAAAQPFREDRRRSRSPGSTPSASEICPSTVTLADTSPRSIAPT